MEEKIIKDLTGNREEHIAPKKPAQEISAEKPAFKRPVVRLAQPAEQMQEHLSGKKAGESEDAREEAPKTEEFRSGRRSDRPNRHGRNDRRGDRTGERNGDRRREFPAGKPTSPVVSEENEQDVPETYDTVSVTVGDDLSAECSAQKDAERAEGAEVSEAQGAPEEMIEVVSIRFRGAGKTYYFDPNGIVFRDGDHAIVETVRGVEYGEVTVGNHPVPAKEVVQPLKPVSRKADEIDALHDRENRELEQKAKPIFYEKVEKNKLDMQLVDVEYTFDNTKLCFYFTAEGRVDFRELVKDLAAVFRTRIELRQIGVRDEARLFGGLGVCGRPFCCKAFLSDFVQVSIKMAKEQNLSLASAKISGSCGRLMCCLRYEQDTYERENADLPKRDDVISTPKGDGAVMESSFLTRKIKVRMLDDNSVRTFTFDELNGTPAESEPAVREAEAPEGETSAESGEKNGQRQERRPRNSERRGRNHGRNADNRPEKRGEETPAEKAPEEAAPGEKPADDRPHGHGDRHRNRHGNRHGNRSKSGQNGQGGQGGQNGQG